MKKYSLLLSLALCWFSSAQTASACTGTKQLTKTDVAFADIIFEGRISDVSSGEYKSGEYVFDVVNVIKGSLSQKQVVVGLTGGSAYSPPKSKEEFISRYGDFTRIALTTPEQIEKFCSVKKVSNRRFRDDGDWVVTYFDALKCDNSLLRPGYERAKEIPFIVRQNCGSPYIFSVKLYAKMEDHKENAKKYEYLIENTLTEGTYDRRELFDVIMGSGSGPLPWEMNDRP